MTGSLLVRWCFAFLTIFPWWIPSRVWAATTSPYRAVISLHRVNEATTATKSTQIVERIPQVRVQGRIRAVGFMDARFSVRRNKLWQATIKRGGVEVTDQIAPILLQGSLAVGGSWKRSGRRILPSAASIIGKELAVTFPGRVTGSRQSRQRIYTIKMKLDGSIVVSARVVSIPRSAAKRGACGAAIGAARESDGVVASYDSESEANPVIAPIGAAEETVASRVVSISTDADPEWFLKYGDQSNAVIASIINTAEAVYNRQLGLRFRIVRQHVYADVSPYTSSEPGALLSAFTRNPENANNLATNPTTFHDEVDLKHLFTGKDIDGSVIGIAYIGVVCAVPSLSYGITQSYLDVANPGIFAHELGHNFGANHDTSDRTGMMYPSIMIPPAERFSDFSLGEINAHLAKYGACISVEQLTPRPDVPTPPINPTPPEPGPSGATITIKKSRAGSSRDKLVRFSGRIVSALGHPVTTTGVRLLVGGEYVGKAVTDANGRFEFLTKFELPPSRQVYVYAETEGGEIFSNAIWVGSSSQNRARSRSRSRVSPRG
jgi:hypothetical protein